MATRRDLPVLDRVRAEATTVTTTGGGHQFEIQLGHLCNNRCVFCASGQLSEWKVARTIALAPIIEALDRARAAGARRLTLLGGEPTIHRGFHEALAHAVALGFEEVVIFTNGVMFPHPGFIERVAALGPRIEWRVSIQGGNEAAHVDVTGRPDSFRRIVTGLRALRALGQRVTANLCVNEKSYRSLPDYPALVAEHGLRQLHVDIVRPSSTGPRDEATMRELLPRYTDMAPHFRAMLEGFEARLPGFDVNVGNLPYCVLPEWAERIHHGGEDTVTQACDLEALEATVDKYEWHYSMRRHPPACAGCAFRERCSGVYGEYLALHGDGEFRAVSPEELRAARGRRRAVRLAGALRALGGFSGWSAEEVQDGDEETVLPLRAGDGARLDVVFLRPGAMGRPGATVDFRLADGATVEAARPAVASVVAALARRSRTAPVP
ncbi:MAG: radical SAM protein [Deltaproteobacteria bacterium]|nr:radical SAM protein [Deltaproteobacteria bacterium]